MLTKAQLARLPIGTILHHRELTNADGTPYRARINGQIKLWKTRPTEFKLPMKHGLRTWFYLTEDGLDEWELPTD